MKRARPSALVQVAPSTQQITPGLVLVRELFDRVGVADLIDAITVKKRQRG